ncbi:MULTISPECIES: wax ester/triacylglycerol synthase family O-acyltransferase [unclassified Rhodococcus (in: high G+C Gram-positive bacteria)]|uniref:WS/DGAT/MGAT family O-acyltransferase n=1 Tax=unclassified Rhodococcus (in: high G+C Gram-positive bacteria) TaxID=192944 RepID=UPI001639F835|nr:MULTISPECIES: wax ester/triacylglycerol synthase family O-acyltransferase [unclassified Rhodococcus (in: high G+C Gram-positive bacteria)]MBC2644461.1 wax ester/triacylglycerol synthase family O-acyltransferase [Rhodococcus sp. 3A]MBC2897851.1 wax ester/triacylglycerol synthase family O-acyltransferase [Rhodococcus sp. 4CII]
MLLPMSPTDSLFLLGESREHPMHVGGLAVFTPPEGADAGAVREMFEAAVADEQVAPLFRRRARRSLTSLGQWGWETADHVDLGHHVRRDALPRPGGTEELLALVSRLHATLLDRSRPLWEMHLIEGLADGRYAVYTKIHHALADGASAMALLQRSMTEDPDRRGMPAPWQPTCAENARTRLSTPLTAHPAPGFLAELPNPLALPGQLLTAARGVAGEIAGLAPAAAAAVERAARARGGPLSLGAPHTVFNVPIGGARHFAARSWPLERVRLLAKHADATVNDIVLTLCAGALRRFLDGLGALPADPLIAMVPVNLRNPEVDRDGAARAGNRVGMLMCNLATHLPDPAHRLDTIRTCMRDGKAVARAMSQTQLLALNALGAAPLGLELLTGRRGPQRPPFNLVISNVAGPTTPLYWNGARLDALYPLSIPVTGQALNITCTSTDDQLVFGLTGCRTAAGDLRPMLDHLNTELDTLDTVVGL